MRNNLITQSFRFQQAGLGFEDKNCIHVFFCTPIEDKSEYHNVIGGLNPYSTTHLSRLPSCWDAVTNLFQSDLTDVLEKVWDCDRYMDERHDPTCQNTFLFCSATDRKELIQYLRDLEPLFSMKIVIHEGEQVIGQMYFYKTGFGNGYHCQVYHPVEAVTV